MNDYVYPSIYFAYFFFLILMLLAVYFFVRSWRDGYWGERGEEIKYHVFEDENQRATWKTKN
jgi:hypothetical protein